MSLDRIFNKSVDHVIEYSPHPVRVIRPLGAENILRLVRAETVKVKFLVQVGRRLRTVGLAFLIRETLHNVATLSLSLSLTASSSATSRSHLERAYSQREKVSTKVNM